jgi:hypothetical protein
VAEKPVAEGCETQTFPMLLNGMTCVPTVLTRVQQSGSVRYRRIQWINRVAPGEATGKFLKPNEQAKGNKKTMKKLMIVAAVSAMTVGAFAAACSDEVSATCRVWDVQMKLKSLGPKKTTCKVSSTCDDTKAKVYYMDSVSRKLKGMLWICDYVCDDEIEFNTVLWDTKEKVGVISYTADGAQTVSASELYAYGKKADKVAGTIAFTGDYWDWAAQDALPGIEVVASGLNGKIKKGSADDDCYIKSLSGYAAGTIAYIKPAVVTVTTGTAGNWCEEPSLDVEVCEEYETLLLPFCGACCFTSWCDVEDVAPDMVPAAGTWSMKYSKKLSKKSQKTAITSVIPAYAL